MTTQRMGAEPVNVGDHGAYSRIAKAWLRREHEADPVQVERTMRSLIRFDARRPLRPQQVSRAARITVDRRDFERFIAIVKFARLRHLVDV